MKPRECESVIDRVVKDMNDELNRDINRDRYSKSDLFQAYFLERVKSECKAQGYTAKPARHSQGFPDHGLNGCGVEVKHCISDSWKQNGNSIVSSLRDPTLKHIYIVFCKFGGKSEVRWKRYEECLDRARSTHKPRFDVRMDLEPGTGFLEEIGMTYKEFSDLTEREKLDIVRDHAITKPRSDTPIWWIPETYATASKTAEGLQHRIAYLEKELAKCKAEQRGMMKDKNPAHATGTPSSVSRLPKHKQSNKPATTKK